MMYVLLVLAVMLALPATGLFGTGKAEGQYRMAYPISHLPIESEREQVVQAQALIKLKNPKSILDLPDMASDCSLAGEGVYGCSRATERNDPTQKLYPYFSRCNRTNGLLWLSIGRNGDPDGWQKYNDISGCVVDCKQIAPTLGGRCIYDTSPASNQPVQQQAAATPAVQPSASQQAATTPAVWSYVTGPSASPLEDATCGSDLTGKYMCIFYIHDRQGIDNFRLAKCDGNKWVKNMNLAMPYTNCITECKKQGENCIEPLIRIRADKEAEILSSVIDNYPEGHVSTHSFTVSINGAESTYECGAADACSIDSQIIGASAGQTIQVRSEAVLDDGTVLKNPGSYERINFRTFTIDQTGNIVPPGLSAGAAGTSGATGTGSAGTVGAGVASGAAGSTEYASAPDISQLPEIQQSCEASQWGIYGCVKSDAGKAMVARCGQFYNTYFWWLEDEGARAVNGKKTYSTSAGCSAACVAYADAIGYKCIYGQGSGQAAGTRQAGTTGAGGGGAGTGSASRATAKTPTQPTAGQPAARTDTCSYNFGGACTDIQRTDNTMYGYFVRGECLSSSDPAVQCFVPFESIDNCKTCQDSGNAAWCESTYTDYCADRSGFENRRVCLAGFAEYRNSCDPDGIAFADQAAEESPADKCTANLDGETWEGTCRIIGDDVSSEKSGFYIRGYCPSEATDNQCFMETEEAMGTCSQCTGFENSVWCDKGNGYGYCADKRVKPTIGDDPCIPLIYKAYENTCPVVCSSDHCEECSVDDGQCGTTRGCQVTLDVESGSYYCSAVPVSTSCSSYGFRDCPTDRCEWVPNPASGLTAGECKAKTNQIDYGQDIGGTPPAAYGSECNTHCLQAGYPSGSCENTESGYTPPNAGIGSYGCTNAFCNCNPVTPLTAAQPQATGSNQACQQQCAKQNRNGQCVTSADIQNPDYSNEGGINLGQNFCPADRPWCECSPRNCGWNIFCYLSG
jgi:hypothetical protein